jgi:transposase InsO family protein
VVERGRMDYNYYRPHGSLDDATPVGFAGLCQQAGSI